MSPRSGRTVEIGVRGGPGIIGGDGLELAGRYLFNVRGSGQTEVSMPKLDRGRAGWTATWVRSLTDATLDVPSTATYVAGALWAVNARFGVPSPETATYSITRLALRR